jgi:hypothetical protein
LKERFSFKFFVEILKKVHIKSLMKQYKKKLGIFNVLLATKMELE